MKFSGTIETTIDWLTVKCSITDVDFRQKHAPIIATSRTVQISNGASSQLTRSRLAFLRGPAATFAKKLISSFPKTVKSAQSVAPPGEGEGVVVAHFAQADLLEWPQRTAGRKVSGAAVG
jgi:hypothetical protein